MSLSINDKLLEGGIKVTSVGETPSSKKGIFASIAVAAALAVGAGGLYLHNSSNPANPSANPQENSATENSTTINNPNVLDKIKSAIESTTASNDNVTKNPLLGNFVKDPERKAAIEKMGNFEIPADMKPNQISRFVAQQMFKKGGYMGYTSSLISEREGFKKHLYNDVGWFAIGNGFNLGVQSKQHIKDVLSTITTDQAYISSMAELSGKKVDQFVPPNFKNITITPQKSIQVAMVMSQTFENSVINTYNKSGKGQELFKAHKDNEKAGLVNIAYQKGSLSSNEGKILAGYAKDPNKTPEKAWAAIDTVSITYMLNGQRVHDTRAETLAKTMFAKPELYEKIIKNEVKPRDIADNPMVFSNKVKTDSKGTPQIDQNGSIELLDPIGDAVAQAEREGKVLRLTIVPELPERPQVNNNNNNNKKPRAVFFGI